MMNKFTICESCNTRLGNNDFVVCPVCRKVIETKPTVWGHTMPARITAKAPDFSVETTIGACLPFVAVVLVGFLFSWHKTPSKPADPVKGAALDSDQVRESGRDPVATPPEPQAASLPDPDHSPPQLIAERPQTPSNQPDSVTEPQAASLSDPDRSPPQLITKRPQIDGPRLRTSSHASAPEDINSTPVDPVQEKIKKVLTSLERASGALLQRVTPARRTVQRGETSRGCPRA
jgi:hypothetical protein